MDFYTCIMLAIIKNNNLELPWGENATIDDIADWFHFNSQF